MICRPAITIGKTVLNAQALVDEARAAGIKFAIGQVRLPASAPPPELLARLREHKAEIAAWLREEERVTKGRS